MSKSSRRLFGGFVTLGLVGSGSVLGYRTRLVSQRKEEIAVQQREADQRLAEAKERARRGDAAFANSMRVAEEMKQVATILWDDRKVRYNKAVADMQSYLVAAPESIGVLQGIIHHSKFLESVLPSYIRFDARAHQVCSMLLELTHGRSAGLSKIAPDLHKYHGYDPFVRVLSEHAMTCLGEGEAPDSIKEVSDSFAYCHNTIEASLERAQNRLVAERTIVPRSPSLATEGLGHILGLMKIDTEKESQPKPDELEKLRRHQADLRTLNTHADVRAAIAYSDKLLHTYSVNIEEAKRSSSPSPFADVEVSEALAQLRLWRESVMAFLLQEQAQRALDSYSLCIVDTLTQLVNDGLPSEDAK